ncbi:response regulator [Bradyrhizobium sp. CSA112]|uniref:response regulator transcription factor n=1 Tax=Bradyrhizobium sp. CSA112 TaxID=2699170 RepID=UPI00319EAAE4
MSHGTIENAGLSAYQNSVVSRGSHDLIGFGGRRQVPDRLLERRSRREDRITILRNRNVVFVVDDDLGTLRGLKRLLREHGYDSVVFSSAEEFQNHDDFESACCVVLDIDLNNESGIELRYRLKAAGISLPVIYITANDSPAVRMAAIESDCIAYLTKPFRAKSLIEPIDKVVAKAA